MKTKNNEYYMENCEFPTITIITFEHNTNVGTYELPGNAGANEIRNAVYSGMLDIRCNARFC